jgi:hypothetical protein
MRVDAIATFEPCQPENGGSYTAAVNRYRTGFDPRLSMAIVGGVLGVVVVAVLFTLRPATGSTFQDPGYPAVSIEPLPFEPLGPEGLAKAYESLGRVTVGGRPATLSLSRGEDLVLPTGRVGAGDGFFMDAQPFTVALPPGHHPVLLLNVVEANGQTVAAAMVHIEGGEPIRWEGAHLAGGTSPEPFAYGVDSGTGSFISPEAVARLRSLPADQSSALADALLDEYSSDPVTVQTAAIVIDPTTGANVVTFNSGYGDGGYASWFGFDAGGRAVALLTSFDLIDDRARPTGSKVP